MGSRKKKNGVKIHCFSNVFSSGLLAFSNRTFMEMVDSFSVLFLFCPFFLKKEVFFNQILIN